MIEYLLYVLGGEVIKVLQSTTVQEKKNSKSKIEELIGLLVLTSFWVCKSIFHSSKFGSSFLGGCHGFGGSLFESLLTDLFGNFGCGSSRISVEGVFVVPVCLL